MFGAESMYVFLGLLHEGSVPSVCIAGMLVAMGFGRASFVQSMLEKIRISNERKNIIQSQLEGMEIEASVEGKSR